MRHLTALVAPFLLLAAHAAAQTPFQGHHTFGVSGNDFVLDGKPFQIRSGEIHYPRVPRAYWRDRFRKARAMGLNAITTYVFWNRHEMQPGKFDFTGDADVAEFVREAGQEGLWVILRPGPYVCAEWEWGGFPWWLPNVPGMKVRSDNAPFLDRTGKYLQALGKQLAPLTVERGGPIIMTQVENEYGSFGNDHVYMGKIRDLVRKAGFTGQLYTADGSGRDQLAGGSFSDLPAAINFGGGAAGEFANLEKVRPTGPRMNGEFWCGWFDHWGEPHHTTSAENQAKDLDWMLSRGYSASLYMFHGGTSFGWWNGANSDGRNYEPDVTSYDYDAPVAEDGRLTPKWTAFREVIRRYLPKGQTLPAPPAELPRIAVPRFDLTESAGLLDVMPKVLERPQPMTFEALGQGYGYVLYRTTVPADAKGTLKIDGLQDRAIVMVGQKKVGTLERRLNQNSLEIDATQGATLDILVENQGRINFSRALLNEHKGIAGASLNGTPLTGWYSVPLPLLRYPEGARYTAGVRSDGPTLYRGSFNLKEVGDTNLDLRDWGHGVVWVNGHLLGRFWNIGAQRSLFLPAPWLKKGKNEVIVLDVEPTGAHALSGVREPIYERPGA